MLFFRFSTSDWATLIGAFGGTLLGVLGSLYTYRLTIKHERKKEIQRKVEYLDAACCLLNEICALQESIVSELNKYVADVEKEAEFAHQLNEVPLSLFSRFKCLNTELFLNAWQEFKLDNDDYVKLYNSFDFINSTLREIYTDWAKNNAEICNLRKGLLCNKQMPPTHGGFLSEAQITQCAKDLNSHFIEHIQDILPQLNKAFNRINTIKCTICKAITKSKKHN